MAERFLDPDETIHTPYLQARIVHEDFYCNHRYAAATSLTAGGLAAQSVNILFQVCFPSSRLHAPVSPGVSAVSSRTLVNSAGWISKSRRPYAGIRGQVNLILLGSSKRSRILSIFR